MRGPILVVLNILWWMSCLPAWLRFRVALRNPQKAQERVLRRQIHLHGLPAELREYSEFSKQPLTSYEDYRSKIEAILHGAGEGLTDSQVQLLEPTSGSGGGRKLIPYTSALHREFQTALGAWLGDLFSRHPGLLRCSHYWSISPSTAVTETDAGAGVPVGFVSDEDYLGKWQRFAAGSVLAVPPEVGKIKDPATHELVMVLCLLRDHRLGLISVWHPSFLRLLLERIVADQKALVQAIRDGGFPPGINLPGEIATALASDLSPLPERARCINQALAGDSPDWLAIWPRLRIISCWADGRAAREATDLMQEFPGVLMQSKGLLATEGVVTIPWGKDQRRVCVPTGHFLEFADVADGAVFPLWELEEGHEYTVILTTGNGFRRYQLGDRVRVTGFVGATPCLAFLGREGVVVDVVGEKLHAEEVERALNACENQCGVTFEFAFMAPRRNSSGWGYVLYAEGTRPEISETLMTFLDDELSANYHYRHARQIGQLSPVQLCRVKNGAVQYRQRLATGGTRIGDVKFLSLRPEDDWGDVFGGSKF